MTQPQLHALKNDALNFGTPPSNYHSTVYNVFQTPFIYTYYAKVGSTLYHECHKTGKPFTEIVHNLTSCVS